jgi:arginine decarboxylase
MGSQVSNVRDIQRGVHEGARFYSELRELGAPITQLDVGGGLAVDYEGTRSRSFCSMNYDPREYARVIVNGIAEICNVAGQPRPDILTEAGRAMTAHHAVLITDVIDTECMPTHVPGAPSPDDPEILKRLWAEYEVADRRSARELVHEAEYYLTEAQGMYVHGTLNIKQRAQVDVLYYALCRRALERLRPERRSDRELLDSLRLKLADKYFCNFSIFQSIPDVWAIDQVFPIVPLNRLNETPDRRAVIKDLTCDSDGRIDRYVEAGGLEETLPVHSIGQDERYLVGIFLVGAYQETLGDIHNLFGDTHSVDVHVDAGGIRMDNLTRGEPAETVLASVGYPSNELIEAYRQRIVASGLSDAEGAALFELLRSGLASYTYLER